MKPKLLVLELWGVGDLAIATPFLQSASRLFEVVLLAKPLALALQPRLWPEVRVIPFTAPWTAFYGKYRLSHWPWRTLAALRRQLQAENFPMAVSARHDPRDHLLLHLSNAKARFGFARLGSGMLLTQALPAPDSNAHRYENWRMLGRALGIELPAIKDFPAANLAQRDLVIVHTGAAQPVRVWPLERYHELVLCLRRAGYLVQIVCDTPQETWWSSHGETTVAAPRDLAELLGWLDRASAFIGNDSGPGHLAALLGVPTFTVFGPQLPHWFVPLHPAAEWVAGGPCKYKPCFDNCRYPEPHCLFSVELESVWEKVALFLRKHGAPQKSRA